MAPIEANAINGLMELVSEQANSIDRDVVGRAARFALESQSGPRDGSPATLRALQVAEICAGMRLDTASLCAALLYEAVGSGDLLPAEVEAELGDEVASLVGGVIRLTALEFASRDPGQVDNYRKFLVVSASDVREILIRLADCLQGMRELEGVPRRAQVSRAVEALEIFAPLAHRMGFGSIQGELEDLAFATLHPRKFREIEQLVDHQDAGREPYIESASRLLAQELSSVGIEAEISGRAKHLYSIYMKMTRKDRAFNEIFDLMAIRVVVPSIKDCYGAIGIIHSIWRPLPGRFKDFVAMPKVDMYQALHTTVLGPGDRPLEVQILTMEMKELASPSHWLYKQDLEGRYAGDMPDWLRQLGDWSKRHSDPQGVIASVKQELFSAEVLVFTPDGGVAALPTGATILDFAYAIHTEIGDRCCGARVNGERVGIDHRLASGDTCEVLASGQGEGPQPDWLGLVRTPRAARSIRRRLNAMAREADEWRGRELLRQRLEDAGWRLSEDAAVAGLGKVVQWLGYRDASRLYSDLAADRIDMEAIVAKLGLHMERPDSNADDEGIATATIHVCAWNRLHLMEDLTRTLAEVGADVHDISIRLEGPLVRARLVVGARLGGPPDLVRRLRAVLSVFDAYLDRAGE